VRLRRRDGFGVAVVGSAALLGAPSAAASELDPISAVAQYVEIFPTATGGAPLRGAPRSGAPAPPAEPLTPAVAARLAEAPRGHALARIATSSDLVAPPAATGRAHHASPTGAPEVERLADPQQGVVPEQALLPTAPANPLGSGSRRLTVLAATLALVTVIAAVAGAARRHTAIS